MKEQSFLVARAESDKVSTFAERITSSVYGRALEVEAALPLVMGDALIGAVSSENRPNSTGV